MQEYDPFIPLGKAVVVCNRAVLAAFASLEILWVYGTKLRLL